VSTAPEVARVREDLDPAARIEASTLIGSAPRHSRISFGLVIAALDGLAVLASGFLAYGLRQRLGFSFGAGPISAEEHWKLLVLLIIYAAVIVVCNASQDLYSDAVIYSGLAGRRKLLRASIFSALITVMVTFVAGESPVPRRTSALTVVISLASVVSLRYLLQRQNMKRIERGLRTRHILIVGDGEIGRAFHRYLLQHRYLGKRVCGFIDDHQRGSSFWLGTSHDLPRILKEYFVDEIYFTPKAERQLIIDVAMQARQNRISVNVVPDLYGGLALGAGLNRIGNVPVLELNHESIPAAGFFFKRLLDIVLAGCLLLLSVPILLAATVAIRLDSPGPVIYAARRVGRKGRRFKCYKLRTMVADADKQKSELRRLNERGGATFKIARDPRITRVGRILRKFSIDEFPQLVNVLKGDMSMVGPRPHPEDDFVQYRLEDLRRLGVLPGITCLWQVCARRSPSFETNVMLDMEYINNWSILLDLRILLKTMREVLRGSGR